MDCAEGERELLRILKKSVSCLTKFKWNSNTPFSKCTCKFIVPENFQFVLIKNSLRVYRYHWPEILCVSIRKSMQLNGKQKPEINYRQMLALYWAGRQPDPVRRLCGEQGQNRHLACNVHYQRIAIVCLFKCACLCVCLCVGNRTGSCEVAIKRNASRS